MTAVATHTHRGQRRPASIARARPSPARTAAAGKRGMAYTSRFIARSERKTSPKTNQPAGTADGPAFLRRNPDGANRIHGNAPQASRTA
jgi:hypothetical protein